MKSSFVEWLGTEQGQYVLQWEQSRFDQLVSDIFGFNAVQAGLTDFDFLRANRMPFRFTCDLSDATVATDLHALPFASASVDLVVLPHALEFDPNPHQVLREVERVLVPEGSVLISGFNPFSLWGVKHRFAAGTMPPWNGRYIGVPRLKDWFSLLGFETHFGCFGCYAPAVSQTRWLQRWHFMENAGDRWWPYAGAVYMLHGIKRVQGMRLITPKWSSRRLHGKALASLTQETGTSCAEQFKNCNE